MQFYSIWKRLIILSVVILSAIFVAPNMVTVPEGFPDKKVKLGLDLQGGAYLLLEVDKDTVLKEFYEGISDTLRATLRKQRLSYKDITSDVNGVNILFKDVKSTNKAFDKTRFALKNVSAEVNKKNVIYTLTDAEVKKRINQVVSQTIEIVRRRIDATGTQEPLIQQQGMDRIVVQLPGVENPDAIKKLLGKTAKMSFHLVDDSAVGLSSQNIALMPGRMLAFDEQGVQYTLYKRSSLGGENLIDAQPSFNNNQPVVSFRFDTVGARKFGRLTTKSVGKRMAIVLDGKVISAPNINEPIMGGSGIISGSFTTAGANELSVLLRAGALPAPLEIVEERSVGPGLGADSIESGKYASVLGLILVILFMILSYRRLGVYATIALSVSMTLIFAVLTALQATLTLPGIAGIVLTIGMAVDANVLIFERIREEYNAGRTVLQAVERGFSSAYLTIIDANITGLIAGFLLYVFGAGPVQGFAVTLSIGIIASMFGALMITRWLLVSWVLRKNPKTLSL